MIRPRRMKQLEITVLERDVDEVIKHLGRKGLIQFSGIETRPGRAGGPADQAGGAAGQAAGGGGKSAQAAYESVVPLDDPFKRADDAMEKLRAAAAFLDITLPEEPGDTAEPYRDADLTAAAAIDNAVQLLQTNEYNVNLEKGRLTNMAQAIAGYGSISGDVVKLSESSFINLKVGKLDQEKQEEARNSLGERALIVPLDGDEVVVASSRKGRFAMDSELKRQDFAPVNIPENIAGNPTQSLAELTARLKEIDDELADQETEKKRLSEIYAEPLRSIYTSFLMSKVMDDIKRRFIATKNAYVLFGWIQADVLPALVHELEALTAGRVAVRAYEPHELPAVLAGREKVPISMKHGRFAGSFERLVFSYGAPLYGTIDPTPFTAVFFAILFAIMFGDVGQGLVLLLLGFAAANPKVKALKNYRHFGGPLKIIGAASMFTGLLYGSVFSNESILEGPTEAVTGFLAATGFGRALGITETAKLLVLMPEKGHIDKLFYFFGFTLLVGVVLNSVGLVLNIINQCTLRRYEKAFFSKNGLSGSLFFWYAVFLAVRAVVQGGDFSFGPVDIVGLALPMAGIMAGTAIFRGATGKRPIFHEGFFAYIMEGIVEILETVSGNISNTVSFLRVGAFALSHAVLSFIIITMAEKVEEVALGTLWSLVIFIFGNALIIVLEGMIVAIQVVRLQYYEFYSKFFSETGKEFAPFRFTNKK